MNAIEQAIQKWAQSTQGQKALQRAATDAYKTGHYGGKGNGTTEAREPEFYAEEMIRLLNTEFVAYGYDFGDYLYWIPIGWDNGAGGYSVEIRFKQEDVSRPSLYPEGYPDGAYNIVALLNRGYHASDYVYGEWKRGKDQRGPGAYVYSMKDREGLWYIQSAVEKFNSLYGAVTKVDFDDIYGWRL